MMGEMKALISVSDKKGIVDFTKYLSSLGIEIISTGSTYDLLVKSRITVTHISTLTSYDKPINSIIKTLYLEIYAGISVSRSNQEQMNQLEKANISPIDFVIVNLFPFESLLNNSQLSIDYCLDFIDIGGSTMLRSAAKSYKHIVVVCDPKDYSKIIKELGSTNNISIETRKYLAKKVFKATSNYDLKTSKFLDNYF